MSNLCEKFDVERDGVKLTVEIHYDDDPVNPIKDYDQVGRMVCWHWRYNLGHERPKSRGLWLRDLLDEYSLWGEVKLDAIPPDWDDEQNLDNFQSALDDDDDDAFRVALDTINKHFVIYDLYLYDHSGLSIRCGRSFGDIDSGGWDSGWVGFIYAHHNLADKEFGGDIKKLQECLRSEVETYDDYLTGNCYGYVIKDEDGEEIEDGSCWGFLGDEKYCIEEAKSAADSEIKRILKNKASLKNNIWINP